MDYDEERRLHVWETYYARLGKASKQDIASDLGMSYTTLYNIQQTKWWKELDKKREVQEHA